MIALCIHNQGAELGAPERRRSFTDETVFHVTLGSEYQVFAMSIWETSLHVLIRDDTGKPNWWPIGLFEFDGQMVPCDWEFALLDGPAASGGDSLNKEVARWGYREMIRNPKHHDELIERQPEALRIFFEEFERRSSEV
jgi:hypothetical protein